MVTQLIEELGAGDKPVLEVFNKCDLALRDIPFPAGAVEISAKNGEGIEELLSHLDGIAANGKKRLELFFPYGEMSAYNDLPRFATVISHEFTDDGVKATADCDERAQGMFKRFVK